MRTTLLRLVTSTEFGARRSIAVLLLILLAVGLCSVLNAVAKPFWYDEICTVIVCRLPGASEIWKALDNAADTNPPVYYLVARLTRQLVSDDHLGYRLPSILGLLGIVFCIYLILSRRVNRLSALVGATFVLCTPVAAYAYEARPYALLLGCISGAILAWQRIDDSRLYSLVLAVTLAAAVSLHYYAILVWPALFMAEASLWIFHSRFRISACAALLVGALPLLFFAPLLLRLRQYYGQNFWAHPSIKQAFLAHDRLFNFGGHWGSTFAAGITVIFLYFTITKTARSGWSGHRQAEVKVLPIEEQTLTLMLLWLPVIAVAAAKISHGGLTERYMLPTVLGGALALGYVIDTVPSAGRVLLLILLLMNYASSSVGVGRNLLKGSLLETRATATREVKAIVAQHDESALPIVISDGLRYLPMAYYTPADSNGKLYAIADPRAAVTSTDLKSDSLDLALLVLRRYFPLQVEDYVGFVSRHREFLLVLGGGGFDWWPARLAHDGYTLRLVSAGRGTTVYKVTVRPN
jgi:hypothetical protein